MADASLVLVNYRTPELVQRCLASVRADARAAGIDLDVVVVDNGSGDGSAARLAQALPDVRVLALPDNRGFAAGVNAGFAASHERRVLVLNPDTEVRPGTTGALLAALDGRVGVAAPLLEHPDGALQPNAYRRFPTPASLALDGSVAFGYALHALGWPHPVVVAEQRLRTGGEVAHVMGAAFAVDRRAYEAAGPLDERFFLYLEETEWQRRVRAAGWAIAVVPAARVVHLVRSGDPAAAVPSRHWYVSAHRLLVQDGMSARTARLLLRASLAVAGATALVSGLRPGNRDKARAMRAAVREARRALP